MKSSSIHLSACRPGVARRQVTFFCFAKRKSPKKRRPDGPGPLRCAPGQPAVLAENGAELELAALKQSLVLIRLRLRSSARPDGWGKKYECGEARARFARPRRSPNPNPLPTSPPPFCMRRGAQVQTDQGSRLSEPKASSSETPAGPSTAGCPRSASEGGRRQQGRLFFAYFLLAKQKKVSSRRATPGLVANHRSFDKLSSNGVPWAAGANPGQPAQACNKRPINHAAEAQSSPTDTP